ATISIHTTESQLNIPVRSAKAEDGNLTQFETTQTGEPLATTTLREFKQKRSVTVDPECGTHVFEIFADNGKTQFENNQLEMDSTTLQRYSIKADNPLSAKAEYEWEWEYGRSTDWNVKTFTRTIMTCDLEYFFFKAESIAWENGKEVFRKNWDKKHPRDFF
ncbi:MAG: hypothetical protein OER96_11525, partial [Gammaproteobacteria bacterium]|nr:hypothetical protein [Gammaproteobacteria bacterium]